MIRSWWFRGWLIYCLIAMGIITVLVLAGPRTLVEPTTSCVPGTTRTVVQRPIGGSFGSEVDRYCIESRELDGSFFLFVAIVLFGPFATGLVIRALRLKR